MKKCKDPKNTVKFPCIKVHFNSFISGGCDIGYKDVTFKLILQIDIKSIYWEIALMWMPQNLLLISHHWFRFWLGAVKQQAITWANVDPDLFLWCH